MEYTYVSKSGYDTERFAQKLAENLKGGAFIALDGELGAGKTVFTKGIARGLGITQDILSPTFTLLRSYDGRIRLNHFDVYRIADEDELFEIGFDDIVSEEAVTVVEWAKNIPSLLPEERISVLLDKTDKEEERMIKITCAKSFETAVKAVFSC